MVMVGFLFFFFCISLLSKRFFPLGEVGKLCFGSEVLFGVLSSGVDLLFFSENTDLRMEFKIGTYISLKIVYAFEGCSCREEQATLNRCTQWAILIIQLLI